MGESTRMIKEETDTGNVSLQISPERVYENEKPLKLILLPRYVPKLLKNEPINVLDSYLKDFKPTKYQNTAKP